MSDSEIKDTKESQLYKEQRDFLFEKQAEWYRLNSGKCLCKCVNCINARILKKSIKLIPTNLNSNI